MRIRAWFLVGALMLVWNECPGIVGLCGHGIFLANGKVFRCCVLIIGGMCRAIFISLVQFN